MKFRFIDPRGRQKPVMPFAVRFDGGEGFGEAASPFGLACLVYERTYVDIEYLLTAWHVRREYAMSQANFLSAVLGELIVVKCSVYYEDVDDIVFEPSQGKRTPQKELWIDGEWSALASLHNVGAITLYEREDVNVFRKPAAVPHSCFECVYFMPEEYRCAQTYRVNTPSVSAIGCPEGVIELPEIEKRSCKYHELGDIEIPPARLYRDWLKLLKAIPPDQRDPFYELIPPKK